MVDTTYYLQIFPINPQTIHTEIYSPTPIVKLVYI